MAKYTYILGVSGTGYVDDGVYLVEAESPTEAYIRLLWAADDGEQEDEYQERIAEFSVSHGYKSLKDMCLHPAVEDIVHMHQIFHHDPLDNIQMVCETADFSRMLGLEFKGWLTISDEEDFNAWYNA